MSSWINLFKKKIISQLNKYEVSGIKYNQSGVQYGGYIDSSTSWSNQTKN